MDKKIILVKTDKGEDEVKSKTKYLFGDIKRVLALVDDKSAVAELTKLAAPSLRASIDKMLQELLDGEFVQDKDKVSSGVDRESSAIKMATPKMFAPKMSPPLYQAQPPAQMKDTGDELDFTRSMPVPTAQKLATEAARLKAEQDAGQARLESETRARAEAEARGRQEAETKARVEAEKARLRAEQEALRAREAQPAAQVRAKMEAEAKQAAEVAKAHAEAEAKNRQEVQAARLMAEQEAYRIKSEAEQQAKQVAAAKADSETATVAKARSDAAAARSMVATVLFFDVVGYTKQPVAKQIELKRQFDKLVSELIKDVNESQRIILDTGDGAAIGFLQHPEDAIEVAVKFHHAITANKHQDYPELYVRMGIHLGPVTVVKDMNGQTNMVGDGINDAQRIMSFSPSDHIYISRAYYDVISRLTAEYAKLFKYRGVEKDKHGREHQVYEAMVVRPDVIAQPAVQQESSPIAITLEPFLLKDFDKFTAAASEQAKAVVQPQKVAQKTQAEMADEAKEVVKLQAQQEEAKTKAKAEEAARRMADEQEKIRADAEQRARKLAAAQVQQVDTKQHKVQPAEKVAQAQPVRRVAKKRGKPLPWGKAGIGLFMVFLLLTVLLPYVWPMQDYVMQIEQRLSAQLKQPVRVGHLRATLLPLPKLELQGVTVGKNQELKASKVELHFDLPALLTETRIITRAEISELAINAQSFDQALSWLQAASGETRYPVMRMVLQQARVSGDELGLPVVNGVLDFDEQGLLVKAVLKSEDGKLGVELKPQQQQSRWQIALTIKDSALPLLPDIIFNELSLNGEVDAGTASFHQIAGRLYGGQLAGSARLSWQNGWQVQGNINVKTLELGNALPQFGITGAMDGDAAFILRGAKLPVLAKSPHLEGKFVVKKGLISKIDMVETARIPGRQGASGGRTHFDELSGALEVDNNSQHLRQIRISAGIMSANGDVVIAPDKQVSGRMNVSLKVRAERGSVPLVVSGTLAEPVWRVGR